MQTLSVQPFSGISSEPHSATNRLIFNPICREDISAQNFVDLTCVEQHHGLKMMASIQNGQIILIAGKNRGFLREIWRHRPFHHRKADCFFAPIELPDKHFTHLWVDKHGNLQVVYNNINTGNTYPASLKLEPKLTGNTNQILVETHIKANPDQKMINGNPLVKLTLKDGVETQVSIDPLNSQRLSITGSKEQLPLPLSTGEYIQHIKPCGKWLQVVIAASIENIVEQRVRYLDMQHVDFDSISSKTARVIFSDTPPVTFAHFAVNNGNHFANANPFVGHKIKHIGNQLVPLSSWIDGIKHRVSRGNEKWQLGRKVDAVKSYAKAMDPGLQVMALWGKQRWDHRRLPLEIAMAEKRLVKQLATTRYLVREWDKQFLTNPQLSLDAIDSKLRVALSLYVDTSTDRESSPLQQVEQRLLDSLKMSEQVLAQIVIESASDTNQLDTPLAKRLSMLNSKLSCLLTHPNAKEHSFMFNNILNTMQNTLTRLINSKCTSFHYQDIELYISYIERTLINVRLYLACQSAPEVIHKQTLPLLTLSHKLLREKTDELQQAIQISSPSMKAWRKMRKVQFRMAESLHNHQNGLGKVWTTILGGHSQTHQIATQIAQRMQSLPKGDSLTLSAQQGVFGFAGIAHFGLPFLGGYFAGVVANYEKNYDCQLVAQGDGKTQVQFIHQGQKSATAMLGTGGGLEDLAKLLVYERGSLVTILPFEATLALIALKESKQSFAFDVNDDDLPGVLSYLFKTEDWDKALDYHLNNPQYTSGRTVTLKGCVSTNSELRMQLGIDATPNLSMVMPRFYAKAGAEISLERRHERALLIGGETKLHDQIDYIRRLNIAIDSGVTTMLFPLSSTHAFPVAIDEKGFIGAKLRTARHDQLVHIYRPAHQTNEATQQGSPNDNLVQLSHWIQENLTDKPQLQASVFKILPQLLKAIEVGYHEVSKEIAADKIEHLKINYDQSINWHSRWADNIRRYIHIRPKYSRSLSQLIDEKSYHMLLKDIKASSQSQSQLLNVGRESFIKATAKYRMDIKQLNHLMDNLIKQLKESENIKSTSKILDNFEQQLSRSSLAERNLFKLSEITFQRISSMQQHALGILPMVKVKQKSQIIMTENLGVMTIETLSNSEKLKLDTSSLDPSLISVPHNFP
ncbi:hypothetical protein CCZ37_07330 [Vibrio qinghaiensis]|uniref:Uncharacterized protein n=1 Tax=Vibrio qinghaiensis TaxID=2025808 RepID=A0A223MY41_9VIBR|nr:hypothetical protein [Vibrio qinghaiensis]ASU22413.1 hypothetical protein CCZ37_07330 [Vibrio qinghaiensis]